MAVVSFVSAATPWSSGSSGTGFTINRPSGMAAGDFMIALLAFTPGYNNPQRTVSVPSGWTKQDDVFKNGNDNYGSQICVMTRQATDSEPTSWSGSISSSCPVRVVGCVAYRSVLGILVKGTSSKAGGSSYSTATVNNTKSGSWRVTLAAYTSGSLNYNLNTNEVKSRVFGGDGNSGTDDYVQIRMADSDASISTGNTSRTISRSASWSASTSWIGILELLSGTPAAGIVGVDLAGVSVDAFEGAVHDDATMTVSLGQVGFSGAGAGTPVVGSGSMVASLNPVSVSVSGATSPIGALDVLLPVGVHMVGETRFFGVRVVVVDRDTSRLIRVKPRAVED